jgi:ATP adenylyltransferase
MKYLFAPWRTKYINAVKDKKGCFICEAVKSVDDEANLVLYRGEHTIVIMNRYPYSSGHIMVCPKRHLKFPYELTPDEQKELMETLGKMVKVLEEVYHPGGLNIGANIGKAAGAGEEHLHFHIVPRWVGDTNFMSVTGETRVIPDTLDNTYYKIREAIGKI